MQDIFVSYRRQDSQSAAGRLSDHLRDQLPDVRIFRDVETIDPGVDFVDAIERALKSCAVLIAVIGPRWLDVCDDAGRRRLDDAHDYTRLEIARALTRKDVRVIPVLVEGASMPSAPDLPEDLVPLARRNAIELSDKRWDYDVSQLVATLRPVLGIAEPAPAATPAPAPASAGSGGSRRKWLLIGVGVVAVLAIALSGIEDPAPEPALPAPAAVLPVPAAPVAPHALSQPAVAAAVIDLTGTWADNEGGHYEVMQQAGRLAVRGAGPDGLVYGEGGLQGHSGWVNYVLNGYPLTARFTVDAAGNNLDVVVTDPATGERQPLRMWRTQ
ncbi:MAG: toll/interleukin-1 receptor domain-containing protein [Rhodocyclaceae bacterium]|nr:toll/interleukin-1 receptor domain-containing protein [Rhodocyclaceae bacterium]